MRSHIVCSLLAVASLFGGAAAGPCKPSTTLTLSTSTTEDSSSSTSEATSSIAVDTTSSLTPDTTLSSATDHAPSSTTSDHVSTSTDITLSTSTDDASSTTTEATTSLTSTTEATASTTETTSSVETSLSTTEVSTTSTEASTTTTEAVTTTSDAPSVGPTFALQVVNSARESVNGKTPRYRRGTTGYGIYLTLGASSESLYSVGDFHIETSTNRLMVGDVYASIGTSSAGLLVAQTADSVSATNYRFLSCTPPVQLGQKLECVVEGTSRTQFYVSSNEQTNTPIYLTAPGSPPGIAYTTFDLIVVSA
ncbi:hypothetical protein FALBO_12054 [Fusarium albosuccineum]|uniref:Uncharacterized protein n=1 Tax=Fusarium albosuccineum TaxID=1237068 RepID=A0A8H4L425_9HYPO|nr:hypothetical protein FALBO_12054 [Fusarium albosuccineum]